MFDCDTDGVYTAKDNSLFITMGSEEYELAHYFTDNPVSLKTFDDDLIVGFEIFKGNPDIISFDKDTILGIDWDSRGTDIGLEFGDSKYKGKISIQDALCEILKEDKENKYILYDHGSGEIADYIAIQETDRQLSIKLYHVKKKSAAGFNSSTADVYEVAGQAVKSIVWLTTRGKFADKVISRHIAGHCQPVVGNYRECLQAIRDTSKQMVANIVIVQPALSRSVDMPDKIQEVLASASSYIKRAGKVQGLEIMGSK